MTCAPCRASASCRGDACPCACHGLHVDVRMRACDLAPGLYVLHLGDGTGPTLCSLAPERYDSAHEPIRMSLGAALEFKAGRGAMTLERVS